MRRRVGLALAFLAAACGGQTAAENASGGAGGSGAAASGGSSGSGGVSVGGSGGVSPVGCTLEVVARGDLPGAAPTGGRFAGPGLVAADKAFQLGYREQAGSDIVLHVFAFSDAGQQSFESHSVGKCNQPMPSDGVALSKLGFQSKLLASLPDCGEANGAGAALADVATSGQIGDIATPTNPAFSELRISSQALVPVASASGYLFAYVASTPEPEAQLAMIKGSVIEAEPPILPLFDANEVAIAGGDGLLAVSALRDGQMHHQIRQMDLDGSASVVMFELLPGPASWVSVAASDTRVALLAGEPVGPTLTRVQVGNASAQVVGSVVVGSPAVSDAAATFHHGDVFIAQLEPKGVKVARYPELAPTASAIVPGSPSADTQVAIVGDDRRIAVAWLDATSLPAGASPGGWAVLQCAE